MLATENKNNGASEAILYCLLGEGVNKEKEEGKEREKEGRTHPRRGPKQKQTGAAWCWNGLLLSLWTDF